MKDLKSHDMLKKFLQNRIKDNRNLFSDMELEFIENNFKTIKKIYILGLKDFHDI